MLLLVYYIPLAKKTNWLNENQFKRDKIEAKICWISAVKTHHSSSFAFAFLTGRWWQSKNGPLVYLTQHDENVDKVIHTHFIACFYGRLSEFLYCLNLGYVKKFIRAIKICPKRRWILIFIATELSRWCCTFFWLSFVSDMF